MLTGCCAL